MLQTLKHLPPWWTSCQYIMTLPDVIEAVSPSVQWGQYWFGWLQWFGWTSVSRILYGSATFYHDSAGNFECRSLQWICFLLFWICWLLDLFCLWPHCAVPWHCVSLQTFFMPRDQTSSRSFKPPTRRIDRSNSMMPRIWPIQSQSIPKVLGGWRIASFIDVCETWHVSKWV